MKICMDKKCYLLLQVDSRSLMTISRSGSFKISPKQKLHNNHLYGGKDNHISISKNFTIEFECKFYMHHYPFDIQHCLMKFISRVTSQSILN